MSRRFWSVVTTAVVLGLPSAGAAPAQAAECGGPAAQRAVAEAPRSGKSGAKKAHPPATAPAPAAPAAEPTTAREWYEKGSVHHKVGELDLAVEAYKKAYKLGPDPVYLYNIAVAYRAMRRWAEALHYFQLYRADDPDSPLRANVDAGIEELERRIAEEAAAKAPPAPAPAPESAAVRLSPVVVPSPAPPGSAPARGSSALVIGVAAGGAAAVLAGAAVVVVVLLLRPGPVDRYLADYPGSKLDFRP